MRKKQIFIWVILAPMWSILLNEGGMNMAKTMQIQLPKPHLKGEISLEQAIQARRSQRKFSAKEVDLEKLGQLLWAAQGITAKRGIWSFRTAPSAGALYPMEIYAVTKDGLFRYLPEKHALEVLDDKDLRRSLAIAALNQEPVKEAAVDFVICTVYERVMRKYAQRGERYAHIEAGHIAQNIQLQAVTLGLGSVPIGAFEDKMVQEVLGLPKDHEPLYIIPVGYSN